MYLLFYILYKKFMYLLFSITLDISRSLYLVGQLYIAGVEEGDVLLYKNHQDCKGPLP